VTSGLETESGHAPSRENDAPAAAQAEVARPGLHLKDAIRGEVVAVLVVLARGRSSAVRGRLLAAAVTERLQNRGIEVNISAETMRRRIREAVVELIDAGEDIASASTPPYGYYVPEGEQEIRDGGKEIWSRVGALVRRGRKYDQNTADRLLEFMGQLGIALPRSAP
jgi:hypothetical protein